MRLAISAAAVCLSVVAWAAASDVDAAVRKSVSIPGQDLAVALQELAKERDFQVVYHSDVVDRKLTKGVEGHLTTVEALSGLLEGTGLTYRKLNEGTVTILTEQDAKELDEASKNRVGDRRISGVQGMQLAQGGNPQTRETRAPDSANAADSQWMSQPQGSSDQSTDARGKRIEEIVVTATKRVERLQDVPFGITALNTAAIEHMGANGMRDYLGQVPGAVIVPGVRSVSAVIMRGVTTSASTTSEQNQPGTEIYLDDVPQTDRALAWAQPDPDLFDLERVEILRGPQGTLFGSGALGGAIRMITNKPNLTQYEAKAEAGVETVNHGGDGNSLRAMANIPLLEDRLALRVLGYHRRDAGWIDNVRYGSKDINGGLGEGARAALLYEPSDAFSVRLSALYNEEASNNGPDGFRFAADGSPYEISRFGNVQDFLRMDMQQYALNMDYDFGAATINSITSYAEREGSFNYDSLVPIIGFIAGTGHVEDENNFDHYTFGSHRFTQELRISSNGDGPLKWTAGAFYLDYSSHFHFMWYANDPAVTGITGLIPYYDAPLSFDLTEKALFGEVGYAFSDKFTLTAGARYASDRFRSNAVTSPPNAITDASSPAASSEESPFTPKLSLSYFANRDLHFYATATKGYRTGQPNPFSVINPAIPKQYGPDSLWNYELGVKSSLLDHRLQLNVAGYYIDWTDIQLRQFLLLPDGSIDYTTGFTGNAGEARSKGVEAELVARPSEWFELGSSLTYTDATLETVSPGVDLMPGSRLPGTPEFSMANYVEFRSQLREAPVFLRLSHRHVGSTFGLITNNVALSTSDSYDVFSARIGVAVDKIELTGYVDNIFDSDAISFAAGGGTDLFGPGFETSAIRLRPRTIGVTLRTSF